MAFVVLVFNNHDFQFQGFSNFVNQLECCHDLYFNYVHKFKQSILIVQTFLRNIFQVDKKGSA